MTLIKHRIYLNQVNNNHYDINDCIDNSTVGVISTDKQSNIHIKITPMSRNKLVATEALITFFKYQLVKDQTFRCVITTENHAALRLFKLFSSANYSANSASFKFNIKSHNHISWQDYYLQKILHYNKGLAKLNPIKTSPFLEACQLQDAGFDAFNRPALLHPIANIAWHKMQKKAKKDSVVIYIISAFRSLSYQKQLITNKIEKGISIKKILNVNTLAGYSEHHTGFAIDIGSPNEAVLEEEFENSLAFKWLADNAKDFGFIMSYPKDNNTGICYEPWHWCFRVS